MEKIYKNTLSPLFWQNKDFNQSIRKKILKIVEDFLKDFEYKIDVEDIRLTGSLANYTYNKYSDLDVHIIADFKKISKDKDIVKEALDGKRFVWNLRHNIFLKGHEVELYFEDTNEQHISSGVFSLLNNDWIKQPEYNPPQDINIDLVRLKVSNVIDIVDRMFKELEQTKDKQRIKLLYNKAKKIKKKIVTVRKEALADKGEFAAENLIFKKLRNEGYIEKLIELINQTYDRFFMENLSYNKMFHDLIK